MPETNQNASGNRSKRSMRIRRWIPLAAILITQTVAADITCYDDVAEGPFQYSAIQEISIRPGPLYGQPVGQSNSLSMPSLGFQTVAQNTLDFQQGLLQMIIQSEPGTLMNSIGLHEFGTFFQFGDTALGTVNTSAFVQVGSEVFQSSSQFSNLGTGAGNWEQSLQFSFPETDRLRLVIDSQMMAFSGDSEISFIDKGGLTFTVGSVTAAPEPGWLGLCLPGLALLLHLRRGGRAGRRTMIGEPESL